MISILALNMQSVKYTSFLFILSMNKSNCKFPEIVMKFFNRMGTWLSKFVIIGSWGKFTYSLCDHKQSELMDVIVLSIVKKLILKGKQLRFLKLHLLIHLDERI